MKYRFEIVENYRVVNSGSMDVTHPNQVIHKLKNFFVRETNVAYVLNEIGIRWVYLVYLSKGRFTVKSKQISARVSSHDVELMFAGAKHINEGTKE